MSNRRILEKTFFDRLLVALREDGYQLLSPQVEDGAVAWLEAFEAKEIAQPFADTQQPGSYRLQPNDSGDWFAIVHGAPSLKNLTYKPRQPLVRIIRDENGTRFEQHAPESEKRAVIGARACDIAALAIQKRVFLDGEYTDEYFRANSGNLFVVAVNCTRAHETCFCVSMDCGPKAESGFDLALTELENEFIVEAGSEAGQKLIDLLNLAEADDVLVQQADQRIKACADSQQRQMPRHNLPDSLYAAHHHAHWEEVATRCLSCTNCTMVCPTCFCHAVEETPDLAREKSERVRVWDSCFNPEHGYIHGKNMRPTTAERYRMWMTHKLGSWIDQFGSSGCTGCGRCITWCPAGIDLVAEARAVLEHKP